jgi:hypothetical protein
LLETRQNTDAYVYPMVEVFEVVYHLYTEPLKVPAKLAYPVLLVG